MGISDQQRGGEQNAESQALRTGRDKKDWINVFLSGGRYT